MCNLVIINTYKRLVTVLKNILDGGCGYSLLGVGSKAQLTICAVDKGRMCKS